MALNVDRVLAQKGLNRAKLSEMMSGKKDNRGYATNILKNPTLETLQKISTTLGVDIVELFDPVEIGEPFYKKEDGKEIIVGYLKK